MAPISPDFSAGWSDRVIAFVADILIAAVLGWAVMAATYLAGALVGLPPDLLRTIGAVGFFSSFCLYFACLDSSEARATIGKRWVKIIVTDDDGNRISFWRSVMRTPFKLLFSLSGLLGLVNVFVILATEEKRGIHDYICGTRVLSKDYLDASTRAADPAAMSERVWPSSGIGITTTLLVIAAGALGMVFIVAVLAAFMYGME